MYKVIGLLMVAAALSSSCSVVMAARKEGVSVEKVQNSRTRPQLIALASDVLSSERISASEFVEVYKIQKERGSAARAVMHGLPDVSTGGLWEVAGTPIEASMNQREYFIIRVTYDNEEVAKRVELL